MLWLSRGEEIALLSGVKTYLRFILATLVAVSCTAPAVAAGREKPEKVDKALAGALNSRTGTHKVIITVQPGYRKSIRQSLEGKGRRMKAEHASLNLLVSELSTAEVLALLKNKNIKALSLDGPVRVHQYDGADPVDSEPLYEDPQSGDPMASAVTDLETAGTLDAFESSLLGGSTTFAYSTSDTSQTSSTLALTTTLRQTLGLPARGTWSTSGVGIGVAIIDSGISPSMNFGQRITGFYDFTNGRNGASVAPYDDYGHGTHVAGLIGSNGVRSDYVFQGVAPGVRLIGLKVLDGTRRGGHERCHRRPPVPDREQVTAERSGCQHVAWPSHLGSGRERPVGSGGSASDGGRPHRRNVGREHRPPSGDGSARIRGYHVAVQRTIGDLRGCGKYPEYGRSERRHRGAVQLERAILVRRLRQA